MGTLAKLISYLLGREHLSLHDFGYAANAERRAIARGLREVAYMRHLSEHFQYVNGFEREFESYFDGIRALGTASGTDALFLALQQAGVGPGTEVITVANTWITTITAVHELGAVCRVVDVDLMTGLMDPARIENAITPATVALIPVHMYGSMVQMQAVMEIARRYRLAVVEDACQAIGASYEGRAAGTWGDAGCFSFFTTKLVGAPGDGGMLVTPHVEWHDECRKNATACWKDALLKVQPRVPSRLSPLCIPFLRVRLSGLQQRIQGRRRQWFRYLEGVQGLEQTFVLESPPGVESSFRNCMLVSPMKEQIMQACHQHRLPVEEIYPQSKAFVQRLAEQGLSLSNSLYIASNSLSLPLGAQMTDKNIDRVIGIIRHFH